MKMMGCALSGSGDHGGGGWGCPRDSELGAGLKLERLY
jgi:hypothetical protein